MDRLMLDTLYQGSRGSPTRVFGRAASEKPLGRDAYGFLLDHVEELDVRTLIAVLRARLGPGLELAERPFVRRLAEVLPASGDRHILEVLRLAERISAEAWIDDLTLPLRGRLPHYQWYRFVDKARGGCIFNALNVGLPEPPPGFVWFQADQFVQAIEEARPEPLVVGLLERAHDDIAAADIALRTQPVSVLLALHERFPNLIKVDALRDVLRERVDSTSESWVTHKASSIPPWAAPLAVQRLHHCGGDEARALYEWLFSLPPGSHDGDAYDLAFQRFKRAPLDRFWHPMLGRHLGTGTSWKTRGRALIDVCIDLGRGFPVDTIDAALRGTDDRDGATAEKHRISILRKIHDETARLLVERAERALCAGDHDSGDLFLSAFMSLDPGSFISGAVHHLRKAPDLPPATLRRIEACEKLARAGNRAPSEDAFFEAFFVLTRQLA